MAATAGAFAFWSNKIWGVEWNLSPFVHGLGVDCGDTVFLYAPRGPGLAAAASISRTMSDISQRRGEMPAAIAGDIFTAELMRTKLYQTV